MRNRIILLLLAWLSGFTLMAQYRVSVYYKNGDFKNYDLADNVSSDLHALQFGITSKLFGSTETLHLDASNAQTFTIGRKTYDQVNFSYGGDSLHIFLLRIYISAENIKVYHYYPNEKDFIALVQMTPESRLVPVADDPARGIISPLRQRLYDYPMAQDAHVRQYIDEIPARYSLLTSAIPLLRTNRISRLPRFKWGLTAGFSYLKLNNPDYDMDLSPEVSAGLFADIPIAKSSFSFHPELLFGKYAANGTIDATDVGESQNNTAAYNQTFISMPLTIRISYRLLQGMAVPYFEAGVTPTFALHDKMEYRYVALLYPDNYQYRGDIYSIDVETKEGSQSASTISCSALLGFGCEWQFSTRHSLYTGLRLGYGFGNFGRLGAGINISYNL